MFNPIFISYLITGGICMTAGIVMGYLFHKWETEAPVVEELPPPERESKQETEHDAIARKILESW